MKPTNLLNYSIIVLLAACFSPMTFAAPPEKGASEVIIVNDGLSPVPVTSNVLQFVGFSNDTVYGDAGIAAMHRTCQATFAGSRMCTSQEIFETTVIPEGTELVGWVQPVLQPSGDDYVIDVVSSQRAAYPEMNCSGWRERLAGGFGSLRRGLTVDSDFKFLQSTCDIARPVACCAP